MVKRAAGLSFFPCAGEAIAGMDFRGAGAAQAWERLGPPGPLGQDGERLSTRSHDNKGWLSRHQAAGDIVSNNTYTQPRAAAAATAAAQRERKRPKAYMPRVAAPHTAHFHYTPPHNHTHTPHAMAKAGRA